jgi:uncharacterized Zn-finger protein
VNKALEIVGKLSRYCLAIVAGFYLLEFLFLLGANSEKAAYLAGGAIARAVIYGAVAAFWFYNARKRTARESKTSPTIQNERIEVSCPGCTSRLRIPIGRQGRVSCPRCSRIFEARS